MKSGAWWELNEVRSLIGGGAWRGGEFGEEGIMAKAR